MRASVNMLGGLLDLVAAPFGGAGSVGGLLAVSALMGLAAVVGLKFLTPQ